MPEGDPVDESSEVQSHDPNQTTQEASQSDVPPADGRDVDAEAKEGGHEEKPHPLDPGGERFKQVYARGKAAEEKLQAEREARARLEGELEVLRKQATKPADQEPPKPTYTWQQLQRAIDDGKITLADALDYREREIKKEAERVAKAEIAATLESTTKLTAVQQEHKRYTDAVPEVKDMSSAEYKKVAQEYSYLVDVLGYDKSVKTEIVAMRNALGDPQTIAAKRTNAAIPAERETMQEHSGGTSPAKPKPKDPLSTLSPVQKDHYKRMIDRGVYKNGWDDVREELTWSPGQKVGKK